MLSKYSIQTLQDPFDRGNEDQRSSVTDSLDEDVNRIHGTMGRVKKWLVIVRERDQRRSGFFGGRIETNRGGEKKKKIEGHPVKLTVSLEKMTGATGCHCCRWTPHGEDVANVNDALIMLINWLLCCSVSFQRKTVPRSSFLRENRVSISA